MKKVIDNKEIKITDAGYLYVDGKKVTPKKITPFYHGGDVVSDVRITDLAWKWASKNYRMV